MDISNADKKAWVLKVINIFVYKKNKMATYMNKKVPASVANTWKDPNKKGEIVAKLRIEETDGKVIS